MESTEFGRTLRRWRDRVTPEAVGLPAGGRRRAVGLRREELAALTGISADYLTRLEQGRATSPSAQVVESLSRALRLPDAERELFYRLAGHAAPGRDLVPSRISPSVQRLLDRFSNTPVAVYDAAMTLVVANPPFEALMGVSAGAPGIERNAVWRNLVGPGTRAVMTAEEKADFEESLVAQLRLTAARYPADRSLRRMVRELTAQSERFAELWQSADYDVRREPGRHKIVEHPAVGRIALDCDTLVVAGDDLRIMIYTAEPGSDDAERLALAIVLGTQALVE
ncbi:helix-turn-helix transcriptional regulator [Herbiconiux daphne]|uniref:Helix-turn-helix transcriptional regulator n=1 Tax=Herbiconiux daphne TaxID=2970914 RepID=A0ABT2GZP1_9MICO|nr:helix-turn-helix transcriptional regulator [Herbiconiux daphne]MCS5733429.1 helix-turn-helix transcriptional regulator [Herbiconiux daphne]